MSAVVSQEPADTSVCIQAMIDVYAFARMLAKIAHGFVAASELGDVEAFLPRPLFSQDEEIGRWVGGAPDISVGSDGLHGVNLAISNGIILVRVRLFAQLGGPEYLVIAGRLIKPEVTTSSIATIEGP
jgi:hypothetical protein